MPLLCQIATLKAFRIEFRKSKTACKIKLVTPFDALKQSSTKLYKSTIQLSRKRNRRNLNFLGKKILSYNIFLNFSSTTRVLTESYHSRTVSFVLLHKC